MKTARRGGQNPLQILRRQQAQLLAPLGLTLGLLLAGSRVLAAGDLSRDAYVITRAALFVVAALTAALIRRWLHLEQRSHATRLQQRAASQRAHMQRPQRMR